MGLILDTNAVSALAEGQTAAVAELGRAKEVHLPVIVLGEYRFGISQSRNRSEYERWLDGLLSVCAVLDIDRATALHYAELRHELRRAGTPIPSNDIWIAALCRQHALPILSRDRHFDAIRGVRRLGW